jgi:hypothetical protein
MHEPQNRSSRVSGRALVMIGAAFVVVLLLLTWAPWNPEQIASNPGPSGMPGSTIVERAPPPAASPSGDPATTGAAR